MGALHRHRREPGPRDRGPAQPGGVPRQRPAGDARVPDLPPRRRASRPLAPPVFLHRAGRRGTAAGRGAGDHGRRRGAGGARAPRDRPVEARGERTDHRRRLQRHRVRFSRPGRGPGRLPPRREPARFVGGVERRRPRRRAGHRLPPSRRGAGGRTRAVGAGGGDGRVHRRHRRPPARGVGLRGPPARRGLGPRRRRGRAVARPPGGYRAAGGPGDAGRFDARARRRGARGRRGRAARRARPPRRRQPWRGSPSTRPTAASPRGPASPGSGAGSRETRPPSRTSTTRCASLSTTRGSRCSPPARRSPSPPTPCSPCSSPRSCCPSLALLLVRRRLARASAPASGRGCSCAVAAAASAAGWFAFNRRLFRDDDFLLEAARVEASGGAARLSRRIAVCSPSGGDFELALGPAAARVEDVTAVTRDRPSGWPSPWRPRARRRCAAACRGGSRAGSWSPIRSSRSRCRPSSNGGATVGGWRWKTARARRSGRRSSCPTARIVPLGDLAAGMTASLDVRLGRRRRGSGYRGGDRRHRPPRVLGAGIRRDRPIGSGPGGLAGRAAARGPAGGSRAAASLCMVTLEVVER